MSKPGAPSKDSIVAKLNHKLVMWGKAKTLFEEKKLERLMFQTGQVIPASQFTGMIFDEAVKTLEEEGRKWEEDASTGMPFSGTSYCVLL